MNYLQLALDEKDDIVSIFEVATGLACNCHCPPCGSQLVAKNKGKSPSSELSPWTRSAHFSHYSGVGCASAPETMIHLLAKSILQEAKTLKIPQLRKDRDILAESLTVNFEMVEIEKACKIEDEEIIPDATLTAKTGQSLFVEFRKTHRVDETKQEKIRKIGISCIEVDLAGIEPLHEGRPNTMDVKWLLLEAEVFKTWIFNAAEQRLYEQLLRKKEWTREESLKKQRKREADERKQIQTLERQAARKEKYKVKLKSEYQKRGYQLLEIHYYPGHWNYEGVGDRRNHKYWIPPESLLSCPKTKNISARADGCRACNFFKSYEKFSRLTSRFVGCKFR